MVEKKKAEVQKLCNGAFDGLTVGRLCGGMCKTKSQKYHIAEEISISSRCSRKFNPEVTCYFVLFTCIHFFGCIILRQFWPEATTTAATS